MYPTRTGRESILAKNPSRASAPRRQIAPTSTASAAASMPYRALSSAAIGTSTAAVINAVVDSGPTDSCRDEPNKTYTVSATIAAHKPVTAGSPANVE